MSSSTSNKMPDRFTKIDPLTVGDHYHLTLFDACYYYGEYTAGQGYNYSLTNSLIYNLKKSPLDSHKPAYQYKMNDMQYVANKLSETIDPAKTTFIPIPSSKSKDHEAYDDRMVNILVRWKELDPSVDYRELITQKCTMTASHLNDQKRDPDELYSNYAFEAPLAVGCHKNIIIIDDVLTTGAHYKAARRIITENIPGAQVCGVFIARRVPEADFDPEDF